MNPRINALLRSAGLVTVGLAALSSTPRVLARQESPAPSAPKPGQPETPPTTPPATPPAPGTPAPVPAQPEKKDDEKKPAEPPKADGGPAVPAKPEEARPAAVKAEKRPEVPKPPPQRDGRGRVILPEDAFTVLAFKNVSVDQVIPFIVEATGKIVIPQPDLLARRVTVINDQRIKTVDALDYVFFALQQNQIGVVETKDMITLRDLADVVKQDVPVIGADQKLAGRKDVGNIVQKVFRLEHGNVETFAETLPDNLPDFAKKFFIDPTTNQIAVMGNVALLQRLELLVEAFDVPSSAALTTQTFTLQFADADKIAQNIKDLFSADTTANRGNQNNQFNPQFRGFNPGGDQNQGGRPRRGQGQAQQQDQALTSSNLRVTANTQQNSVTVLAERVVLEQIKKQIEEDWDIALDPRQIIPRTYLLKYADPVKVRNLLESLFGNNSSATGSTTPGGQGGGGQGGGQGRGPGGGNQGTTAPAAGQGVGRLAGQFVIEAIPETGTIVVVAKSPDNLTVIDEIIKSLDKPQVFGMPKIIPLKHAQAEELAEQLNAILAQEGTLAQITKAASGLSTDSSSASPFSTNSTTNTSTNGTNTNGTNAQTATGTYQFWWQRARPPTDTSGSFSLVSKVRIVPVWRQNSLMLLAPPEYQDGLADFIEQLDSPGRQVLIAAIVVEIRLDDATALGLRWSTSGLSPTNPDNALSLGNAFTGTKNQLINSLFDTSVLTTTTNINLLIQALAQKTAVNILSEPRIFTSDNQEASFFDGQDVPFVNQLQTTNTNNPIQSFDYRAVGIKLGVRPRITINKDVDLQVNLELSSISPGQTVQNALIVDRRQTTTHLIVKDGQTIVISGILRRQDSDITRKIPLLGDIPFLGYLFTSTEVEHSNTELIAFITPIVVENTAAADEVNAKDLGRLHELRNNQFKDGQHGSSNELVKPTNEILPNPPPPPPADGNPPAPNPPAPGPGNGSS